jgi:hypothetical protein
MGVIGEKGNNAAHAVLVEGYNPEDAIEHAKLVSC